MDIETLITQLRRYSGYIDQAAQSLELAIQVGGTRRCGRPRKIHVAVGQPKLEPVPGKFPERMKMMKQTIDQGVLQMALVGFELQRDRIEAAIAEIQAELGQGDSSRSISTATASAEPKTTGKRRFSAAARKRMGGSTEEAVGNAESQESGTSQGEVHDGYQAPEGDRSGHYYEAARQGECGEEGHSEVGSESQAAEETGQEGSGLDSEDCYSSTAADAARAIRSAGPGGRTFTGNGDGVRQT